MGILPGAANSQATVLDPSDTVPVDDAVATVGAVCVPHHIGVCSCHKPALEIDNRFEESGGQSPGTRTHCFPLFVIL